MVYSGRLHMPRAMHRTGDDEWRDNAGKTVHSPHVNFAGKYFVAIHSCGTGCRYYTLTDLSSGRELDVLEDFSAGETPPKTREGFPYLTDLVTKPDSKLLVAQYRIDSPRGPECRERAFVFDRGKLTPVGGTRRSCTDYSDIR